jgi:hypothetical protein
MQWNNFLLGLIAGFFANWLFGMAARLLPPTWIRYRVQIEGCAELDEGMGFKYYVGHVRIEQPRWKRILREPLSEYIIALIRLDGSKFQHRTTWLNGDDKKTQALLNGATTLDVLLFTLYGNNVYLKDDYPEHALSRSNHVLTLVVRRTVDGADADKTDILFEVTESGFQIRGFNPASE